MGNGAPRPTNEVGSAAQCNESARPRVPMSPEGRAQHGCAGVAAAAARCCWAPALWRRSSRKWLLLLLLLLLQPLPYSYYVVVLAPSSVGPYSYA